MSEDRPEFNDEMPFVTMHDLVYADDCCKCTLSNGKRDVIPMLVLLAKYGIKEEEVEGSHLLWWEPERGLAYASSLVVKL